jgi:tape measure domain-containing protein
MATIDTYITKLVLDAKEYIRKIHFAGMSAQQFGKQFGAINSHIKKVTDTTRLLTRDMNRMQKAIESAGKALATSFRGGVETFHYVQSLWQGIVQPIGQAARNIFEFGVEAAWTSARLEALKIGLNAITGSVKEADRQWRLLREVAKLPGLNFEQAAQGVTALQASGLAADLSFRSIITFGNALATIGKGAEDLHGVNLALGQIARKGKVYAEEILQLQERLPQIGPAMKAAFGTGSTEELAKMGITAEIFIEKIVAEFEKNKSVTLGWKVAFENLKDSATLAMGQIGDSLNKTLTKPLKDTDDFLSFLVGTNKVGKLADQFLKFFQVGEKDNSLVRALAWVYSALTQLPTAFIKTGNQIGKFFNYLVSGLKMVLATWAGLIGMQFGIQLVSGIKILVNGFLVLRRAIMSAGVAAVIMEAIATGGASAAKAVIGLIAGLAAAAAAMSAMDKLFPQIGMNLPGNMGFDMDKMKRDADSLYLEFLGYQKREKDKLNFGNSPSTGRIDASTEYLKNIEKNTRDSVNLQRIIMGGGDMHRIGVTSVEIGRMKAAARGKSTRLADVIQQEVERIAYEIASGIAKGGKRYA